MGRRLPGTPRSKVRAALRQLSLRSRERAAAMKRAGYCCERCGIKQSKAKGKEVAINGHHREGVGNWEIVIDLIFQELLCDPSTWEILCVPCHKAEHQTAEPFSGLMGE